MARPLFDVLDSRLTAILLSSIVIMHGEIR